MAISTKNGRIHLKDGEMSSLPMGSCVMTFVPAAASAHASLSQTRLLAKLGKYQNMAANSQLDLHEEARLAGKIRGLEVRIAAAARLSPFTRAVDGVLGTYKARGEGSITTAAKSLGAVGSASFVVASALSAITLGFAGPAAFAGAGFIGQGASLLGAGTKWSVRAPSSLHAAVASRQAEKRVLAGKAAQ